MMRKKQLLFWRNFVDRGKNLFDNTDAVSVVGCIFKMKVNYSGMLIHGFFMLYMYMICISLNMDRNFQEPLSQKYCGMQEFLLQMDKEGTGCVFADHVRECEIINSKDDLNQHHVQRHRVRAMKVTPLKAQTLLQHAATCGPTHLKPTELDHTKDFQKDTPKTTQLDNETNASRNVTLSMFTYTSETASNATNEHYLTTRRLLDNPAPT